MTRSGQQDLRICRRASLSGMSRSATSTASARAYARSVGPAQDIDGIVIRAGTPAAGTLWSGVWGSKPSRQEKNHNARMSDRPHSGVQCPVLVLCNKVCGVRRIPGISAPSFTAPAASCLVARHRRCPACRCNPFGTATVAALNLMVRRIALARAYSRYVACCAAFPALSGLPRGDVKRFSPRVCFS